VQYLKKLLICLVNRQVTSQAGVRYESKRI
jgi:hypothetical protein